MRRPSSVWNRTLPSLVLLLAIVFPGHAQQELRTEAEESGFERFTGYENMLEYLQAVQAATTEMRLTSYGETREGRDLVYAIFSRPLVTTPWEAMASGKPVVLFAANVHGGERTHRESLLILVRELATPGTAANALLDDMIILVAPSMNPDGFVRGIRGNAWGIDLNRDYMKLEHPSLVAFVDNMLNRWQPHLVVDGHNGGAYPYNLTYQCPSNAAADQRLTHVCDHEIFPLIDQRLEENDYQSWYFSRGTETRWNVGGSDPRIGRNYGGLRNTITILFEAPGRQTREDGIKAGLLGFKAVAEYVQQNSQKVLELTANARDETIRMGLAAEGDIPVRQRYEPEDYQVTYKIVRDGEIVTVTSDSLMKKPVPTLVRPRPYAYILPRDAVQAVDMLLRHGITVEVLQETASIEVDAYTLEGITYRGEYNHAATPRVTVGDVVTLSRDFPTGTYVVPTGQALGRVVTHILEPESSDNVIRWNTMNAWLPKGQVLSPDRSGESAGGSEDPPLIPIFKVMQPTALPTRLVR